MAFCSNIVVTIDGSGKYFIEIVQSLTRQTISVRLTRFKRERESRIDAQGIYICVVILIVRVNATILSAKNPG